MRPTESYKNIERTNTYRTVDKMSKLIVKEKLMDDFKKKGVYAINEKRRITHDALGYAPTFSAMKENEMVIVIEYLKGKSSVALQSTFIGWFYMVAPDDGLTKGKMRKLMESYPSDVEVYPFVSNAAVNEKDINSKAIGFIHKHYYDEHVKEINETIAVVCSEFNQDQTDKVYTLANGMQIKLF